LLYAGPIIDAHIHLWRYTPGTYPWLAADGLETLHHDHLAVDYLALSKPCRVRASVHIEAGWGSDDPLAETRWLETLALPKGVGDRYVARVYLDHTDAERQLEEQASFHRVVGIRDILAAPAKPENSTGRSSLRMDDPLWRQNFARLAALGLSFDLLIAPWQAEDACRLARDHPDTLIVINHCASPMERDIDGMARWRRGLRKLADAPNTVIKISDPVAYDPDWTDASLHSVILTCIEVFGPERAIFASDFPVSGLHIEYGRWIKVFSDAVAQLSEHEQSALFHDTAARIYKL
jgi:predicted TIM-barrel fold metal-dependent hydrolase